jgi:hypothetical protein
MLTITDRPDQRHLITLRNMRTRTRTLNTLNDRADLILGRISFHHNHHLPVPFPVQPGA